MIEDNDIRINAFRVNLALESLESSPNREEFDRRVEILEDHLEKHFSLVDSYLERKKSGYTSA